MGCYRFTGENLKEQAVWEMDAILPLGKELVLNRFEVVSPFQVLPPKHAPICFERAVIGLGSQCGLSYCATNTPTEIYRAYSKQIQEYYWSTAQRWNEFLLERAVDEKEKQAKYGGSETKFSPTKCLQTARYYNFEEGKVYFAPQYAEPRVRQGEKDPDSIDQPTTEDRNQNHQASQDRRPIVAIVERLGTRAVLNIDRVIFAIVNSGGFRLKVLSYDSGCGIPETAYLMRDVNILISTHGNALGGSLWMPSPPSHPHPVVISIDSTKYYENWFQWTSTAMAQRFIIHRCGPAVSYYAKPNEINEVACPLHRDLHLARTLLKKVGLVLNNDTEAEDLLQLTGAEYPIELFDRFGADQELSAGTGKGEGGFEAADKYGTTRADKLNTFLSDYWKRLARYADPFRLLRLLEDIRDENAQQTEVSKSYLQICREGRCCGPECVSVMNRNVVGRLRACDQDMREGLWGEHRWNKEQDEFSRSGQSFEPWSPK
ncbi:hypothetical protein BGZ58_004399 [Dissophora ornata]|nr:hypothetical protein BGZ58_004399 [Dissophora ornata]